MDIDIAAIEKRAAELLALNSGPGPAYHFVSLAPEEMLALLAERAELIEALVAIRDFEPDVSESDARRNAAFDASGSCEACSEARRRQWPPSGLCNDHYTLVSKAEYDAHRTRNAMGWHMKSIAREVLARGEKVEEGQLT